MSDSESQRRLGWLLVLTAFVVIAVLVAPFTWFAYSWRDTTPRGPLAHSADWPRPIQDIYASMMSAGIEPNAFAAYLIYGRPGDTDSTVICRMQDSPRAWDYLSQRLELKSVPNDKYARITAEAQRLAPPDWWPDSYENVHMFASGHLLAGDEGDLYVVVRDAEQSRIYIHYFYNF